MLQSLEILNGEMTPKFEIYNNIYSVAISEDVTSLSITYVADDDSSVEILNNSNFIEGENIVSIEVTTEKEKNVYTLLVNKEKAEVVSAFDMTYEPLEVVKELPSYVAPLIGMTCFFIILCTFSFLFRKRKK